MINKRSIKIVLKKIEWQDIDFNNRNMFFGLTKDSKLIYLNILYNTNLKDELETFLQKNSFSLNDLEFWIGEFSARLYLELGKKYIIIDKKCFSCYVDKVLSDNCVIIKNCRCPLIENLIMIYNGIYYSITQY